MKELYTLIVVFCFGYTIQSQIVNIPDVNFKNYLLENPSGLDIGGNNIFIIDTNNDNEIQETEALQVVALWINYSLIENLIGIEKFTNLTELVCIGNPLSQVDLSENLSLTSLNLSSNQLTSLDISSLVNLVSLECSNNNLISLNISQNTNLTTLICFDNQITSQNLILNSSIEYLDISINQFTTFDFLQAPQLKTFVCDFNEINDLLNINLALQLESLNCNANNLNSIDVTQNINLFALACAGNNLNSINVSQNKNLKYFSCHSNNLNEIDLSQNIALEELNCGNNNLSSLNVSQNSNLRTLICSMNQLTTLNLPETNNDNLIAVDCRNNLLSDVNFSGLNFFYLKADNNFFETLDFSSSEIINLTVNNNPLLTNINIKNNINEQIFGFGNPIIGTPNLQFICTDEGTELESLTYTLSLTNPSIVVNSYCSFVPGGTFYTIQGNTKFDNDNSGCDLNDLIVTNIKIAITDGSNSSFFVSNDNNEFSIPVQQGIHTITPILENPSFFSVSPVSVTISFPAATSPFTQDFCITANGIKNDLEITIIPIEVARPGFDAYYKIVYKNKGNQIANGTLTFSFDDTIMDLISSIPSVDDSGTNIVNWNFTDLNPFETREINLIFNVNSPMETPAVNGGDILVYTATIVGATDEIPNDNTFILNQTVVNSYDPNDKTCLEGNTISPEMVGQYVHYVIRFENTGTFAAENVVIADIIDNTKFEISSLVPQSSSHDFITRINGNKVEFIFENINLPFDDENNDGYVAFKIKTKSNLVVGNTFTNKANIYFDYNFPIITNTTSTTVEEPLSNQDFDFKTNFTLYPNPAKEVLNIKTKTEMEVKSISIYNTLGQIIMTTIHAENGEINVSNLQSGSYFIKVFTEKGSSTAKFIKK